MAIRRVPVSLDLEPRKSYQKTNFADMMVNLSVKDKKQVTRKIRLVGVPCPITEYTDKKYTDVKGKTVKVPFPDAHLDKRFTRIGNSDPNQCAWAKLGYVSTTQWVQNVLERTEDGEWVVKILKKGKSIFQEFVKWEKGRQEEEDLDASDAVFSGVQNSHCFRIVATATGLEPPLSVEYRVTAESKPTELTEDMIELLRKAGAPSAEELAEIRDQYNVDRKQFGNMPQWEDHFAYGYNLDKIFKYQPPKTENVLDEVVVQPKKQYQDEEVAPDLAPVASSVNAKKVVKPTFEDDDDEEEEIPFM
jgi:hypothetical protein